jgi:hypothetical protein
MEDVSSLISKQFVTQRPGQLFGVFNYQDRLIQKIYNKYYIKNNFYYQKLLNVSGIEIQSTPGVIVFVKDSKDSDFNKHILENGYLRLQDSEADIRGLYFYGIHLENGNYVITEEKYDSFS